MFDDKEAAREGIKEAVAKAFRFPDREGAPQVFADLLRKLDEKRTA